jgi:hypothetical protein
MCLGSVASKPLWANDNFKVGDPTSWTQTLDPLGRGIIRFGELLGLRSRMVQGATGCRETTGADRAEIRRTYCHGLPAGLTDDVEYECDTFTRLERELQMRTLI